MNKSQWLILWIVSILLVLISVFWGINRLQRFGEIESDFVLYSLVIPVIIIGFLLFLFYRFENPLLNGKKLSIFNECLLKARKSMMDSAYDLAIFSYFQALRIDSSNSVVSNEIRDCVLKLGLESKLNNWKKNISIDIFNWVEQYSTKHCCDCRLTKVLGDYGVQVMNVKDINKINLNIKDVCDKIYKKAEEYSRQPDGTKYSMWLTSKYKEIYLDSTVLNGSP